MAEQIEKEKPYWQRYYEKNRAKILPKRRKSWKAYYLNHKQELLIKTRRKKWALKQEVLTHYGNGKCACVNCSFDDIRALSIDHIEGGGHKERLKLGKGLDRGGVSFYRFLRQRGYPEGYQTLCMNCQVIKQVKTPIELL